MPPISLPVQAGGRPPPLLSGKCRLVSIFKFQGNCKYYHVGRADNPLYGCRTLLTGQAMPYLLELGQHLTSSPPH